MNVLEIVRGIAQAASASSDGAVDSKGDKVEIGLKREEGNPITDSRISDGFGVKISGNVLTISYHAEMKIKDCHSNSFETDIESMISKISSFIKKEYKSVTGSSLSLTKDGSCDISVEYISKIRTSIKARQNFKIGGMKDLEGDRELPDTAEKRLDKSIRDWLNQGPKGRVKNDDR